MKNYLFLAAVMFFFCTVEAQQTQIKLNHDSVSVTSKVEFYTYNGPYGDKENIKEPAIKFVLTVKNKGSKPIPIWVQQSGRKM